MTKTVDKATLIDIKSIFHNGRPYVKKDFDFHELVKLIEIHSKIGEVCTIYDTFGDPLAIFGAYTFKEGRASVWCFASEDIAVNKFTFFKTVKRQLEDYVHRNKIVKVESYVREDDARAMAFLTRLGFAIEGKQLLGAKDFGNLYYMGKVVK